VGKPAKFFTRGNRRLLLCSPAAHRRPCLPCGQNCGLTASCALLSLRQTPRGRAVRYSQSARASQLRRQKIAPLIFYLLRFGSRLLYLRCFCATPTPTPDRPPLKTIEFFILFALPRSFFELHNFEIQFFLPEKKEYAKLAITHTGSKGQALRVFEKILPAAAPLLLNLHIIFSSFSGKK